MSHWPTTQLLCTSVNQLCPFDGWRPFSFFGMPSHTKEMLIDAVSTSFSYGVYIIPSSYWHLPASVLAVYAIFNYLSRFVSCFGPSHLHRTQTHFLWKRKKRDISSGLNGSCAAILRFIHRCPKSNIWGRSIALRRLFTDFLLLFYPDDRYA